MQVFIHNWITYIRMRSLAHIMQQFHWTRATCGEVWPRKITYGCKPGFSPPCGLRGAAQYTGGSETRFAAMCALSWSNFATSCSRPMKLLHYVSQAPHTNICNSIMHKDLQNAAISLNESNWWRRLTTKDKKWLKTWFQPSGAFRWSSKKRYLY